MAESRLTKFEQLVEELKVHVPFRIRYKNEAPEMEVIAAFVEPFSPDFMENYTTVIGSTIYFPDRYSLLQNEERAMRTLAHEAVHLLDAERWRMPLFSFGYILPQVLALGILAAPWLGWWALLFLLFLLPLPSPFRFYFEARAYAIDMLLTPPERQEQTMKHIISQFSGWGYYRMFPFPKLVEKSIRKWMRKAELGQDPILVKVLLLYEMVDE